MPLKYLPNLHPIADEDPIRRILRSILAVRTLKRRQSVDGSVDQATLDLLASVGLDERTAEDIYRLTTLPTLEERFVLPPYNREMSIEAVNDPLAHKGSTGFGRRQPPKRSA
jgi:nitrate reductase beta subunit